jgi:hypothetical protein
MALRLSPTPHPPSPILSRRCRRPMRCCRRPLSRPCSLKSSTLFLVPSRRQCPLRHQPRTSPSWSRSPDLPPPVPDLLCSIARCRASPCRCSACPVVSSSGHRRLPPVWPAPALVAAGSGPSAVRSSWCVRGRRLCLPSMRWQRLLCWLAHHRPCQGRSGLQSQSRAQLNPVQFTAGPGPPVLTVTRWCPLSTPHLSCDCRHHAHPGHRRAGILGARRCTLVVLVVGVLPPSSGTSHGRFGQVPEPVLLQSLSSHLASTEGEVCFPPEVEDDCLSPEVLLHIAYEVVSQLGRAEEFKQLLPEGLSLHNFLREQICTLKRMTTLLHLCLKSPLPPQVGVGCFGVAAQSSHAPSARDGGPVV